MEAIEFIRCGEPHGISSSPHWSYRSVPAGAKTGSYYPKAEADAEIKRFEAEVDRLKTAIKTFSDKWQYYDSKTIAGLDELRQALSGGR